MTDIERKIKKLQNRKIIYVVIACLLIALNLMVDLMNIAEGEFNRVPGDGASRIGYFLGSHFLSSSDWFCYTGFLKSTGKLRVLNSTSCKER